MTDQLDRGSIGLGISIGLGLNVVAVVVMIVTGGVALPFLGMVQLLYLVPIALFCRHRQRPETMKGIIIIAAITLLLNAACDVMVRPVMRDLLPMRDPAKAVSALPYSCFSALIEPTRLARRARTKLANSAATTSTATIMAKVNGSLGRISGYASAPLDDAR